MRISALEEYGLRALLCIANYSSNDDEAHCGLTIPEIAETEGISIPYASKVMRKLRQGGLVKASRGRTGGYYLTKSPDEITLSEALMVLGGPLIADNHCELYPGVKTECVHNSDCSLRGALGGLVEHLNIFLTRTTIGNLAGTESQTRKLIKKSMRRRARGNQTTFESASEQAAA